jgi:Protein of unknown function (DUF2971)
VRPHYLYKYLSLEPEHIDSTLSEAALWFSRPEHFNDPFDLQAFFHFDGGTNNQRDELYKESIAELVQNDERFTQARRAELVQEYQRKYPTLEAAARLVLHEELYRHANLSNIGVLCLSATGTDPVMFSHYCNNHRGICVEFRVHPDSFFARAEEVTYQLSYPVLDFFNPEAQEHEYRKLFLTKYEGWRYEREWRVLDFRKGYGLRPYRADLLVGVTFGIKTSDVDKARVKSWLRRRGHWVKLFQARLERGKYELKRELIDEVGPSSK